MTLPRGKGNTQTFQDSLDTGSDLILILGPTTLLWLLLVTVGAYCGQVTDAVLPRPAHRGPHWLTVMSLVPEGTIGIDTLGSLQSSHMAL